MCLLACSGSKPYAPISGTLTVHTGLKSGTTAHVLVGDGTKFNLPVDANGDAVFHDASLQGPQTVTAVYETGGSTQVSTIVGINRSDLWLRLPGVGGSPSLADAGVISGTVSGFDAGDDVYVVAVAPYGGATKVGTDGSYSFGLNGQSGDQPLSLVAADTPNGRVLGTPAPTRVGMAVDVPFAQRFSPPPISLDHPLDQTLHVSAHDADGPRSNVFATAWYLLNGNGLFTVSGTNPGSVPLITPSPPFDQTTIELNVSVLYPLPYGGFEIWNSHPAAELGTAIDVTVPEGLKLISPVLTDSGPHVPVADFKLAWEPSTLWTREFFTLWQAGNLVWTIDAPGEVGQFSFFPLPSNASPTVGFSASDVTLSYRASGGEAIEALEDSYGPDLATPSPVVPGGPLNLRSPPTGQAVIEIVQGDVHLE